MNLLQKSLAIKEKRKAKAFYGKNEFEAAMAFLKDEITTTQLSMALSEERGNKKAIASGNALYFVAAALRQGVRQGKISISLKS